MLYVHPRGGVEDGSSRVRALPSGGGAAVAIGWVAPATAHAAVPASETLRLLVGIRPRKEARGHDVRPTTRLLPRATTTGRRMPEDPRSAIGLSSVGWEIPRGPEDDSVLCHALDVARPHLFAPSEHNRIVKYDIGTELLLSAPGSAPAVLSRGWSSSRRNHLRRPYNDRVQHFTSGGLYRRVSTGSAPTPMES
jgi:hypothetical protein